MVAAVLLVASAPLEPTESSLCNTFHIVLAVSTGMRALSRCYYAATSRLLLDPVSELLCIDTLLPSNFLSLVFSMAAPTPSGQTFPYPPLNA